MLVRNWWFFTADWPPPNYDFSAELERRSLKEVKLEKWDEPDHEFESKFSFS